MHRPRWRSHFANTGSPGGRLCVDTIERARHDGPRPILKGEAKLSKRLGARSAALAIVGAAALAVASSASAKTMRVVPDHINPMVPAGKVNNDTVTSSNWSGYAVQDASQFTLAQGSWVEPTATCNSSSAQYASFWVGIDGYSSNSVEQLGTDSDCRGRGHPSYYAWYEMYPANSVELSTSQYPVKPGDTLSASVTVSGTNFTLSIASSEGWSFKTTQSGAGAGAIVGRVDRRVAGDLQPPLHASPSWPTSARSTSARPKQPSAAVPRRRSARSRPTRARTRSSR